MKNSKCAHCANCDEIKYDGFFCDMTGYVEDKRVDDDCPYFEADIIEAESKQHGRMTNADRIRRMTDEELAELFAPYMHCNRCDKTPSSAKKNKAYGCNMNECKKYALIYMKQVVNENADDS